MLRDRLYEFPIDVVGAHPVVNVSKEASLQAFSDSKLYEGSAKKRVNVETVSPPRRSGDAAYHLGSELFDGGYECGRADVMGFIHKNETE